jgi:formylglycine-generating enzyme required for sulfatase activity
VIVEADKVRAALQKLGAGPAASGSDVRAALQKLGAGSGASGSDYASKSLGMMKWIPAGTFMMGSPSSESGRYDDETQHRVTLTKGYWLMEHEVTQGEWEAVMGSNPSTFKTCGPTCPVEQVSWGAAVAFAKKASARDGVTYALPTEAQWEYAARGGQTTGQQTLYAGSNEATSVGWISDNSFSTTHAVCGKARNGYGLCDMTGNVWEWTSDGYGDYGDSATDPAASGSDRVFRGGGWRHSARSARVADRGRDDPSFRFIGLGFRLSRTGT